jgi:ferrous iron transport protein A
MMMPLTMAAEGIPAKIVKVGGRGEVKRHLENLGFVTGGEVTIVSILNGNVIVNVKDSRIAISRELANKIMV